jgi:hypothetical protein
MFLGDFHPFGNSCPSLSVSQNSLCSAVFEFIENDANIYTKQRYPIEKALLERIKNGSYDNIPATKAFENLLVSHKKYIVESLNKIKMFVATHGKLTTLKLNKTIRRHISCLLVNNFLEEHEHEIKKLTDEGEPEEHDNYDKCEYCDDFIIECECPICCHCDEKKGACKCFIFLNKNVKEDDSDDDSDDEEKMFLNMGEIPEGMGRGELEINFMRLLEHYKITKKEQEQPKKEIIIEKDEIITFSRCGRCENTLKTCICYTNLIVQLDSKIEAQKKEIFEMEDEQAEYIKEERKRLWEIINQLKEDNKAQEEIINSHQPIEKECNDEINKLKEELKTVKIEYKDLKKVHKRTKKELEQTERFRQENSKAVKETVDETYKLNAEIKKLKNEKWELINALPHSKFVELKNKLNL